MSVPLVLVHGGGHGAWCWEPTLPHLAARALAVDLPPKSVRGGTHRGDQVPELWTLTIGDFADSVIADAATAGLDRFVLVGHSMGGLTISEVARRNSERVVHLVYVSCIVPPEGRSAIDAMPTELRETTRSAVDRARADAGGSVGALDEATIRFMFCNDMDEEQTRFVVDHFGTEAAGPLAETVTRSGIPPEVPKTYVKLQRDQSLEPAVQDGLIEYLRQSPGGEVDVLEIDAGHDVMISQPVELAAVLNAIASRA